MTAMVNWARGVGVLALALVGCADKEQTDDSSSWWLLPDIGDEAHDGADGDADGDDEDADFEPGAVFWGEVAIEDGVLAWGALGFAMADEDGELICELEYAVTALDAAAGCEACDFAYTLTYGALDFSEGDTAACEARGWTGLEGTQVKMGGAGETLFRQDGDAWREAGFSELDGSNWFFEGTDSGS